MDRGDTLTEESTEVNDFGNHGILAVSKPGPKAESVPRGRPIVLKLLRIVLCGHCRIENLASQFVVIQTISGFDGGSSR